MNNNKKFLLKVLSIIFIFYILFNRLFLIDITSRNSRENFSNFDASSNIPAILGNIFKHPELNLSEYPNVEIKPGERLFTDNKFLPECCFYYSQYSTDRGCPCITPEQQYYLQRRGLNKDPDSFIKSSNDYQNIFFSPSNALKGNKDANNDLERIYKQNNIYFKRDEPPLSDLSINEAYRLLNNQ